MDRDRNTVVKALECSANGAVNCFDSSCFYHEPGCACDRSQIMLDALALLKEQEAEIRQLKLALDIAKGTCKGIGVEGR